MPGLVNAHDHVFQLSERGLGKNLTMEEWLRKLIYPINKILDADDYYELATMACADAFRNGVTSIVEQLTNFARFHADSECRAFLGVWYESRGSQRNFNSIDNRPWGER